MSQSINKIYKNNAIVYKILLFLVSVVAIVYLFPKGGQFKYDFTKGKPWQYENLYATFDFSIQKEEKEIASEKQALTLNNKRFFEFSTATVESVKEAFTNKLQAQQ
ncbi:MAG: phosphohydrolase, partial [Flavobacteriaceae bacterium]|nr:phosphohydrolase [Flavobacteriaceae bacterium]